MEDWELKFEMVLRKAWHCERFGGKNNMANTDKFKESNLAEIKDALNDVLEGLSNKSNSSDYPNHSSILNQCKKSIQHANKLKDLYDVLEKLRKVEDDLGLEAG